jgi:ornithine cyclodeaminase/alanine dehydrogenase-like protein (mu-crystallin family)
MATMVDEETVKRVLSPESVIEAIEGAFGQRFANFFAPKRYSVELPGGNVLLSMPCYDRSTGRCGVKLVTVVKSGAAIDERVQATYLLFSSAGKPELIMSANTLTDIRTAATTALATKYLARTDARTLGIFGTGRLAWAHASVLPRAHKFDRIIVCGSSVAHATQFAARARAELFVHAEAVDAEQCARQADVLCTCTTATSPLFDGHLLRPGTHVNLVGAFRPNDREADDTTMRRATIVVDTYDGALAEAGDLLIPLQNGSIRRSDIVADLHELVTARKPVHVAAKDITVFKSVGYALEDFVTAELVLRNKSLEPEPRIVNVAH